MNKLTPQPHRKSSLKTRKPSKSKPATTTKRRQSTSPSCERKVYTSHSGTFLSIKNKHTGAQHRPKVTGRTYISHDAILIGEVQVGPESCVLSQVTIRGDNDLISIGAFSNVQEGSVLHTDHSLKLQIGNYVTIGHKAMIHGCSIGDYTLIGMGATIMNNAKIGKNCIIGANALVLEGKTIPDNSVVVGSPGKVVRETTEKDIEMIKRTAAAYSSKIDKFFEMVEVAPDIMPIDPKVYQNAV